jgi:hypothetical protein
LALLLRRQYEFPQCGINKGIFFFHFLEENFLLWVTGLISNCLLVVKNHGIS